MSYIEALQDGITKTGPYYNIPCGTCETGIVKSKSYRRDKKYTCQDCKSIAKGKADYSKAIVKETKFRDAISRIELMVGDMEPYQEAIEKVHRTLHHEGWYKSTEEMMAAIELLKNGVRAIHNQKIGRYHVDFALPDHKIILEIDGKVYHNSDTRRQEGIRDGNILLMIGLDWKIIRLDTDRVNNHIERLIPSIIAIDKAGIK